MATTQAQNQAQNLEYFNLHVNGVGYLNRVRWVTPNARGGRRSEPFLACSIAALRGNSGDPAYTYFDLRVSGQEAIDIVSDLEGAVVDKRKVFVSFRCADIYPHLYDRDVRDDRGRPTGQRETAALTKGRLILINSVTVDGERVFTRKEEEPGQDNGSELENDSGASNAPEAPPASAPTSQRSAAAPRAAAAQPTGRATSARGPSARRSTAAVPAGFDDDDQPF